MRNTDRNEVPAEVKWKKTYMLQMSCSNGIWLQLALPGCRNCVGSITSSQNLLKVLKRR